MALNFRRFLQGIGIVPKSSTTVDSMGEMEVLSSDGKVHYHNGTTASPVVTEAHTATLTNKSLTDNSVTFVDSSDATKQIKIDAAGTTGTSTTITGSQTANRVITLPDATGTLSTDAGSAVLTNKKLDDTTVSFVDTGDNTKQIKFDAGGTTGTATTIAASQTADRTINLPNNNDTLVGRVSADQGANRLKTKDLEGGTVRFVDASDTTKIINFDPSTAVTNTTTQLNTNATVNRVITLPDATTTLVGQATADALTNKTHIQVDNIDLNGNTINATSSNLNLTTTNGDVVIQGGTGGIINLNGVTVSAPGDIAAVTKLDVDSLRLDGQVLSTTGSNLDIQLTPNGTGKIVSEKRHQFLGTAELVQTVDSVSTGADATLSVPLTSYIKLTNVSLTSIRSIAAGQNGTIVTLTNGTGASIILNNEDTGEGTAGKRIVTGTGNNLVLSNDASLDLIYDNDSNRWKVVGGTGSGSGAISMQTNWTSYTPTFTGFGTPSNINIQWRRDGSDLLLRGYFQAGTVTATVSTMTLPTGLNVSNSILVTNDFKTNFGVYTKSSSNSDIFATSKIAGILTDNYGNSGSTDKLNFAARSSATGSNDNDNTTTNFSNNDYIFLSTIRVPINGWNSVDVPVALPSNYQISASSGLFATASTSYIDVTNLSVTITTTGHPVELSLVSDGNTTPGNEASIYAYSTTGDTARAEFAFIEGSTLIASHVLEPSISGSTSPFISIPSSSLRHFYHPPAGTYTYKIQVKKSQGTGFPVSVNYSKLVAAEQVVGSGANDVTAPRSSIHVSGNGNGHGSTYTSCRRFTTTDSASGSDITYLDSATDGATFTINTSGIYSLGWHDRMSGGGNILGFSRNQSGGNAATAIESLSWPEKVFLCNSASTTESHCFVTTYFAAGDVLRFNDGGRCNDSAVGGAMGFITKVAN